MKYQFTKDQVQKAVSESYSIANVCKLLGIVPRGGNYKTLKSKFKQFNIDTSHFTGKGWNVGLKFIPNAPKPLSEILVENSTFLSTNHLKKRLFKEGVKKQICECCGITEWNGSTLVFEMDHINGNNTDHRIENLQILCPNCHSQTSNFRGKNKKTTED